MEFQLSCTDKDAPLLAVALPLLWGIGWRFSVLLRSCLSPLAARMTVSWHKLQDKVIATAKRFLKGQAQSVTCSGAPKICKQIICNM